MIILLGMGHQMYGQSPLSYTARHITHEDGQSLGYCRDVIQDSTGLLWISSNKTGIHTFDGQRITTFHPKAKDFKFDLPHSVQMVPKSNGNFIISDYNYPTGHVYEYNPYSRQIVDSLVQDVPTIKRLYEPIIAQDGKVWVVSDPFEDGDWVYLYREGASRKLQIIDTISVNTFPRIITYRDRIYVSGASSINAYTVSGAFIKQYPLSDGSKTVLPMLMACEGADGELYVKSDHAVEDPAASELLFVFDQVEDKFVRVRYDNEEAFINTEYIKSIGDDLWLGGLHESLWCYKKDQDRWEDYTSSIRELVNKNFYILGVFEGHSDQLWVTTSAGLFKLEKNPQEHIQMILQDKDGLCRDNCHIMSIADASDAVYFSYLDRIAYIEKSSGSVKSLNYNLGEKIKGTTQEYQWDVGSPRLSVIDNQLLWMDQLIDLTSPRGVDLLPKHTDFRVVHRIIDDQRIWLAPFYPESNKEMLYEYDLKDERLRNISPDIAYYPDDLISDIYPSKYHDKVWVGLQSIKEAGVLEFTKSGVFIRRISVSDDASHVTDNITYTFYEDKNKNLWIGTGYGLAKLELESDQVTPYPNYLPSTQGVQQTTQIFSIAPFNDSTLWLGAKKGIHRFDLISETYTTPPLPSELTEISCTISRPHMTDDDQLYIGTKNGVLVFDPQDFEPKSSPYPIAINNITRYNTHLQEEVVTHQELADIERIELQPSDLWLSVDFSLPDYSDKTFYSYRLLGFDDTWSQPTLSNTLKYTNLPAGSYTLELKASQDPKMLVAEARYIHVLVHQVWYKTWWFLLLASIITACVVAFILRHFFQLERNKLQLQQERDKAVRLEELDEMKSRFYTNITHEFRTPLTVIMGIADNIRGHVREKDLIQRNSENLLRLINQLLDLSKSEYAHLQVQLKEGDIVVFLKYLTESFYSLANSKNIRLTFYSELDKLHYPYDEEKIQQIFYNLLSNAIKYTEEYGKVILHLKSEVVADRHLLQVKIKDTGIGIAADQLPHVFDRFYQADSSQTRKGEGTGVGLALTKELVHLLEGKIEMKSERGVGTEVTVQLPIPTQTDISIDQGIKISENIEAESMTVTDQGRLEDQDIPSKNTPIILLIEDNEDVAAYVEMILSPKYDVYISTNGKKGVEKAIEIIPDIIISDVMMPVMDGYEVCHHLKQDSRTSHIPIIMLTAKATTEDRIDGLSQGADAYLVKPFNKQELLLTLDNMLDLIQNLRSRVGQVNGEGSSTVINKESTFVNGIMDIIHQHLDSHDLGVDLISKELGLSRSQVYRKLKAITGKSISQLISEARLDKAKELLSNQDLNISEVAYAVGYQDPSYFSRAFYKEYGKSPSDYRK